ncbi:MAG: hypothetical protein K2O32_13945 [Acetatifactor sp.]|nr:hypothetical protein [Acetatifactor sp.]
METKDWISILIPIVFNGIIAMIFGKYFENKLEIKKYKESKKQKIEDKLYDLLIQNKSLFYEMKTNMSINISVIKFGFLGVIVGEKHPQPQCLC